jgi:hypothetical protein
LGEADKRGVTDMLAGLGMNPVSVRVLTDETGKSKGAAFVDFKD